MARIITITSGKGGVGKTSISLNLALSLSSKGFRVCLFDADLGLANVNILTGIFPKKDLKAVIKKEALLDDILIKNYQGIDIIPGSSGVQKLADLTFDESKTLIKSFIGLDSYDFFIFDTSAGISSQVLSFCMACQEIILVATTEPTSLTDAYSLLKVLSKRNFQASVKVIINQAQNGKSAQKAYSSLKDTVKKFLSVKIKPLGIIAADKNVGIAVISQTPFLMLFPDSKASRCIKAITDKLINSDTSDTPLEVFWNKTLDFLGVDHGKIVEAPFSKKETLKEKSSKDEIFSRILDIEDKIDIILNEIKDVKKLIKNENIEIIDKKPEEISLDFESWLENQS